MGEGYWVKGYPYTNSDMSTHRKDFVIHRFDTLKEAQVFMTQVANGIILPWGDGKKGNKS